MGEQGKFFDLLSNIVNKAEMPNEWNIKIIMPMWKKVIHLHLFLGNGGD